MKLLLDTHTLLWWWTNDRRLSAKAIKAIENEENIVLVSAASAWEIATKHRIGKLPEGKLALDRFNELVAADEFVHLPMNHQHALRAGAYPVDHRDPFDRMLAAQSEIERATLVSLDPAMSLLNARPLW